MLKNLNFATVLWQFEIWNLDFSQRIAIANVHVRAIQKTKTENNKALYPGAHPSKLSTFGGFRYREIR